MTAFEALAMADLEAERALVATALTMPELLGDLAVRVRPADFTMLTVPRIFAERASTRCSSGGS